MHGYCTAHMTCRNFRRNLLFATLPPPSTGRVLCRCSLGMHQCTTRLGRAALPVASQPVFLHCVATGATMTYEDGGHEEATGDGEASADGHEDEVEGGGECQRPLGEIGRSVDRGVGRDGAVGRVRAAHAEQLDDGLVGVGQEQGGHIVVVVLGAGEPGGGAQAGVPV